MNDADQPPDSRHALALAWTIALAAAGVAVFLYDAIYRVHRAHGAVPLRLAYCIVPVLAAWLWLRLTRRSPDSRPAEPPRPSLLVPIALAVCAAAASAIISSAVFERLPHVQDEVSYDFQARVFAAGHLFADAPPATSFFDPGQSFLIVRAGPWYSLFPPGNSLLLALGYLLGVPWLLNPILAAAAVLAVYALGRAAYDHRTGVAASALITAAPGLAFMAGSRMSHTAVLALCAAGLAAVFACLRRGALWLYPLAGLCFGVCSLIRPLDGVLFCLASAAYLLWQRRGALRGVALMLLAFAAVASANLVWNQLTNGSPFLQGHRVAMPTGIFFGLGRNAFGSMNTIPLLALSGFRNAVAYADMFWGWPLNLFLVLALWPWLAGRPRHQEFFLLGLYVLFVAAFFFYYHPGLCLGARYFWPTYAGLAVLLARALVGPRDATAQSRVRALTAARIVIAFCVLAWFCRVPAWIWAYRQDFWQVSAEVGALVKSAGVSQGLIFLHEGASDGPPTVSGNLPLTIASTQPVAGRWYSRPLARRLGIALTGMNPRPRELSYRSGMIHNSPWPLDQRLIFLKDLGPPNYTALALWPGRPAYLVYCDRRSGAYVLYSYAPR
jgi:4-amino-4-deoxy-L-arabinose transferase-like glycosyltransferase